MVGGEGGCGGGGGDVDLELDGALAGISIALVSDKAAAGAYVSVEMLDILMAKHIAVANGVSLLARL